ncbi:Glycosyl hydrolase family 61 [Diplocarpon rosae]|nr:Glycosyl hydrolase family 61 [Diplocarpon rosae]
MSLSKMPALVGSAILALQVSAHGTVSGIVADGVYPGYSANYQYMATQPVVVGWSTPQDTDNGFIAPDAYADPNIICHKNATNAQASATVKAGGTVELQWTTWPSSHHGPVLDYLADCGGDCKTVDKTTLKFFKIDGVGLLDDTTLPGNWATDTLEANNNTWSVTIPASIAPGNYVLRHEIIALHSAGQVNGAQNYPQCVNLQVTGSGTDSPAGTLGTALYQETDAGIEVNIYATIASYAIPGPALYEGAVAASQGVGSATGVAPAAVTTTPAATQIQVQVTPTPANSAYPTAAPTDNSTQSQSQSACKSKSKIKTSSSAALSTAPAAPHARPASTTDILTLAANAVATPTIPASYSQASSGPASFNSDAASSSSSAPTTAPSTLTTPPSGTTLGDLLAWLSSFFTTHSGTSYTSATIARRHARDVVARAGDTYPIHDSRAQPSGVAHPSHPLHHHPHHHRNGSALATSHHSGPDGARPTRTFSAGSALPTDMTTLEH